MGEDVSKPARCARMPRLGAVGLALCAGLLLLPSVPAGARSPEADVAYERGARALRQNDAPAAVAHLGEAAEAAPDDVEVLTLYGRALLAADRPGEARPVLERVLAQRPDAVIHYLLGVAEYRSGRWAQARDHLAEAARLEPGDARVQLFLGSSLQELGDFEGAERHLREAARLDPALADAVDYRLGVLAAQRQDWDQARRFFDDVQARSPDSALAQAAEAYLRRLEVGAARPYSVWATVGFAWDDNVNLAGSGQEIRVSQERDWRGVFEVGGYYTLLEEAGLRARVGHVSYLTYHTDEHDFDVYSSQSWAEGSYDLGSGFGVDLRYTYEYSLADFDDFRRVHRVEPAVRYSPAPGWLLRAFYRYEIRDFFIASAFRPLDRDGQLRTTGFDVYAPLPSFFQAGRGFARLGYRHREESTSGDNFDSHGNGLVGTLLLPLPLRFALVLDGYYERRHYARPSLLGPGRGQRDDHIREGRIALRRTFNQWASAEAGWRRTSWSSNVPAFDFSRSVLSLLVTFRY